MRVRTGRLIGSGALGAALLTAPGAWGQSGVDMQLRFDLLAQHLGTVPTLYGNVDPANNGWGLVSTGRAMTLGGFGLGFDLVLNDRYVIPLLMTQATWATGHERTVHATPGQAVAELHPWTAQQYDLMAFGFGRRWKHRRWMAGFLVQPGVSLMILKGSGLAFAQIYGLVRATVETCRRLDPEKRICLFGGPNVVLDRWFNGGVAGLRVEYGP